MKQKKKQQSNTSPPLTAPDRSHTQAAPQQYVQGGPRALHAQHSIPSRCTRATPELPAGARADCRTSSACTARQSSSILEPLQTAGCRGHRRRHGAGSGQPLMTQPSSIHTAPWQSQTLLVDSSAAVY